MNEDILDVAKTLAKTAIRGAAKETVVAFTASGKTQELVESQVKRIVTQDPVRHSWRAWSVVWSTAAAVLAIPEVQLGLQAAVGTLVPVAWAPIVPALMGAIWAGVSKARDLRPIRSQ